jgi:serine/threonine-protein kinase
VTTTGTQIKTAGDILFGYEILDAIGTGAGSILYAASDPASGQLCALKHVVVAREKDVRFVEQLRAEFEVGRQVRHPGLRRAIAFKEQRGGVLRKVIEAALVLELFDGTPIDQTPASGLADILARFVRVADALAALHRGGAVHCDLKPSNILVGGDAATSPSAVKVIDFGQACPIGTIKPRVQGTPDYIAPEQVRCAPVTPRTDVFNFGATLYRVLTDRTIPTLYTTGQAENSFLLHDRIPSPRDLNPRVPEPLSNLVMECVRTNPEKRPAEIKEVGLRLEIVRHGLLRAIGGVAAAPVVAATPSTAAPPRWQYRLTDPDLYESRSVCAVPR